MADRVKESYQVIRERNGNYQLRQYNGSHAEKKYTTLGFFVVRKGISFRITNSYTDPAEIEHDITMLGPTHNVRKDQQYAELRNYATGRKVLNYYMEARKREKRNKGLRNMKRRERYYGDDALEALQILEGEYVFQRQADVDLTDKAKELVEETTEKLNRELKLEYIRTLLIIFENVHFKFPDLLLEMFPDDKHLLLRVLRSHIYDKGIRRHMEERFGTKFDDFGKPKYENEDEEKNWYNEELDI